MNTFYHGDCKVVMNHDLEPKSIDLIYLDPPFFTGIKQKGIAKWKPGEMPITYEDGKQFWEEKGIADDAPDYLKYIAIKRPDFAAYLFYMRDRLKACRRVLKDTGSIYLHCDWRASHYLKMIMDEEFGAGNFKNEIIWHYGLGAFGTTSAFPSKHDTILFYSKTKGYHFHKMRGEVTPQMEAKYCHQDTNGRYMMSYGKRYYLKGGKPIDSVWDLPSLSATDKKERVGYPTQKPVALLKRIILASSDEGDTVLDPFCGCGTTIIAAHNLRRYWIGIDISKDAYEVTIDRKAKAAQHRQGMDDTFSYVERDLKAVLAIKKPQGKDSFEEWVNGYYRAKKPFPDEGIDGITQNGIPIQAKAFKVTAKWVNDLLKDARTHPDPDIKQPCQHAILVSQIGFDSGARQKQFELQVKDHFQIDLRTPQIMLDPKTKR